MIEFIQDVSEGMLILGVVKDIREYELVVSLPNSHTGFVQITNISDSYKALLQKITDGNTTLMDSEEVRRIK